LLQKAKVAGPRIFRENTKRKAITDSYDLNRIAEVACIHQATDAHPGLIAEVVGEDHLGD
jgi:hypothetical protein